jgi:3-phenylpropionate/cinnamic acid dioxygenase small subunit
MAGLPPLETERAIIALIFRAARLSDDQKFLDWMGLFAEDGVYSAITHENAMSSGLYLFKDVGRRALHVRAAFLMGLWQSPRGKTTHLVSNIEVRSGEGEGRDAATAVSNFIMTRTAEMEHSKLHASGTYHDRFERQGDGWLFKERHVVVDTNVLPPEFTELL